MKNGRRRLTSKRARNSQGDEALLRGYCFFVIARKITK
ncbi:hypothetical protein RAMDARK_0155 [Rickettsia amblyommatis str. Darkwater]|uniref:Uncharacterized protein n=2 Tax=spotted fever group TaxID=114277 RepID=A0A0F3N026_RICAM|nr:hypothetical protein Rsl_1570 [Rickettsia slovaca 13-B]KJV61370.1 hypothetical protein APHACPA_0375 [Rickettsia amblyommatis str. Ac/Pa]KJV97804.1 hypothetical protein RAMDARK_0155 [Rickettsia amblyommatis str. Darkwater]